jgi:hypothetical protein
MKSTLTALFLFVSCIVHCQQKLTDTIFFDSKWRICEEELAKYYRVGVLAVLDSFWYYTGPVKDYKVEGRTLVMEGVYNEHGLKAGPFRFYSDSGILIAAGNYRKNRMEGIWKWFSPKGFERAVIYFPGVGSDFKFIKYATAEGKVTLENGVGEFEWISDPFDSYPRWIVKGAFNAGIRTGSWHYMGSRDHKDVFEEIYNADGSFSKRKQKSFWVPKGDSSTPLYFSPVKLVITEGMLYHDMFRKSGDSLAPMAVAAYLIERKTPELRSKFENFDTAMFYVFRTLYKELAGKLEFHRRLVDASISMRLGDAKRFEEISVNGNLDSTEKAYVKFLMRKFSNIDMPTFDHVAIEKYHTIYMYTLNVSAYIPVSVKIFVDPQELIISHYPKHQFIAILNATKKELRRDLKKAILGY